MAKGILFKIFLFDYENTKCVQDSGNKLRASTCPDGQSWNIISSIDFVPIEGEDFRESENTINWQYNDPATFDSLAFDKNNNLFLLSGTYGIFKYEGGKWIKWINLTNEKYLYFSLLHVLDNNRILVGFLSRGLIVLNIDSGTYKRIKLGTSIANWD